jgi:hypothetical protein
VKFLICLPLYKYKIKTQNILYRTKEEIDQQISNLIDKLRKTAMEDLQITFEEQAIMDKIEEDLQNLQSQIIQVLESELDDEEFDDLVNDFLNDIIHNIIDVAKLDGTISDDELRLINAVQDFVHKGGRV